MDWLWRLEKKTYGVKIQLIPPEKKYIPVICLPALEQAPTKLTMFAWSPTLAINLNSLKSSLRSLSVAISERLIRHSYRYGVSYVQHTSHCKFCQIAVQGGK